MSLEEAKRQTRQRRNARNPAFEQQHPRAPKGRRGGGRWKQGQAPGMKLRNRYIAALQRGDHSAEHRLRQRIEHLLKTEHPALVTDDWMLERRFNLTLAQQALPQIQHQWGPHLVIEGRFTPEVAETVNALLRFPDTLRTRLFASGFTTLHVGYAPVWKLDSNADLPALGGIYANPAQLGGVCRGQSATVSAMYGAGITLLHELGHAVDAMLHLTTEIGARLAAARQRNWPRLDPYDQQPGGAGLREFWADAFAAALTMSQDDFLREWDADLWQIVHAVAR